MLGYVHALSVTGEAVRAAIPALERPADMLRLARSGQISRGGEAGGYFYEVHGAGADSQPRMGLTSGLVIDVDFAPDGAEIFDFRRLRWLGQRLPEPLAPAAEDLRAAVESLNPLPALQVVRERQLLLSVWTGACPTCHHGIPTAIPTWPVRPSAR
ncbi:DUF6896 domain-containing protein [Streptomyces decoyicus]|uniref:DUF6896 domain-containing protein n=1 Tax=Streptomyces decoyicus TaxID=249567 RepID=UPI00363AAB09